MQKSYANKYLKRFTCSIILFLLFVAAFNWFIDPYGIYSSPRVEGINTRKPEIWMHSALSKAYSVKQVKPQTIILGSSRAWIGIDPDHRAWAYTPVYNLSLPGATTYEMLRYFQHVTNIQPVKQILLSLDFFVFNALVKERSDYNDARLSIAYDGQKNIFSSMVDVLPALLSLDALYSSKQTVVNQDDKQFEFLNNGLWIMRYVNAGTREQFISVYKEFFKNWVSTNSTPKFQFVDPTTGRSPFDYYRQLLQIAYRDNIDMRIATSPSHVLQWEIVAASRLWPEFEQWKRMIVQINEEEAKLADKSPFPLWDFSLYNEYTTEAVPPLDDKNTQMQWYWESSHYKKELGDLMLNRIFNYQSGRPLPDNLGILLTTENIDEHLQKLRADRANYRFTHPDYVTEVEHQLDRYLNSSRSK